MIGDDVEITVLDIRGDKVRLGIRAPAEVPVHRKEVYLAMREENKRAATSDAASLKQALLIYQRQAAKGKRTGKESTGSEG